MLLLNIYYYYYYRTIAWSCGCALVSPHSLQFAPIYCPLEARSRALKPAHRIQPARTP